MRSRIIGTGSALPETVLTSAALARSLDVSEEWILQLTGVRERRVAEPGVAASDLAAQASRRALEAAAVDPEAIDLIVVATVSGDTPTPSTACWLQAKIGARRAYAFDVSAASCGGITALAVADQFLRSGAAKRALVVGVEVLTRFLDWKDRSTCILFGDGAGAAVLEATPDEGRGIVSFHLHSDGALADILWIPGLGSREPASAETVARGLHHLKMNGREVFKHAVRGLVSAAEEELAANGMTVADVDHLLVHQANLRIINAVLERIGVPRERCALSVDRYGNTSAASAFIGLDETRRAGKLAPGQRLLLLAAGAGMGWGSMLIRW